MVATDSSKSCNPLSSSTGVKELINDRHVKAVIDKARVARLATADSQCRPHLVPVVFTFDGKHFHIPIDDKIKQQPSSKPERLKRVKNIQEMLPCS